MRIFSLLFLCVLFQLSMLAQEKDAGLWTGIKVGRDIVGDFSGDLEMEARFDENITEVESAFLDLSIEYKISSFMDVSVDYRFGNKKQLEDHYLLRQRVSGNVYFDVDWRDVEFVYRFRYQRNFVGVRQDEYGIEFSRGLRHRLSITFDLPDKYEIETEFELFTGRTDQGKFDMTDWRAVAELSKEITGDDTVGLAYLVQRQMNESNPLMEFIFLISYSYDLD